jgi:subtilase family protein
MSSFIVHPDEPSSRTRPAPPPARVVVKFHASSFDYVDGAEKHLSGDAAEEWQKIRHRFPGISLLRLFTSVSPTRLDELVRRASAMDRTYTAVDFKTYYVVNVPRDESPEALAAALAALPGVQRAYVESPPTPPPTITLEPLSGTQRYLNDAPEGISAKKAWDTIPGAPGNGITFADVEQGWALGHEDLPADPITGASLVQRVSGITDRDYLGHGSAVIGILLAVDNGKGCVGIVPNSAGGVVSIWRSTSSWNISDALISAVDWLKYGDVLVIEATVSPNGTAYGGLPVEAEDGNFDVVRLATALGIAVVEAAGNANQKLDDVVLAGPGGALGHPFARLPIQPGYRDSGAILVACGYRVPSAVPVSYERGGSTNFGSRIDCFAEGRGVGTVGSLGRHVVPSDGYLPTTANPGEFSGTSAASAIVAGAAVSLQGMVQARAGYRLSGLQVRKALSDDTSNTHSHGGTAVDMIGVMPDLVNANATLPDLVIRDFPGDVGDPHSGPLAMSPDIIVRGAAVPDPQAAFGEGSGTENDVNLSDPIRPNQDHYVYVRVRNRGGKDAGNVKARVYWAEPATLVLPSQWHLIGEATVGNVAADNRLDVSPAMVWPAAQIPGAGHYCFVAQVGDEWDPMPWADDLRDWDHYLRFIREVNNVTWRNFDVVPVEIGARAIEIVLSFLLVGPRVRVGPMGVEIETIPPSGCGLGIELPQDVLARTQIERLRAFHTPGPDGAEIQWAEGHLKLSEFVFDPGLVATCRLHVRLGEEVRHRRVDVIVRQVFEKEEVGRMTWRLVPQV